MCHEMRDAAVAPITILLLASNFTRWSAEAETKHLRRHPSSCDVNLKKLLVVIQFDGAAGGDGGSGRGKKSRSEEG